MRDDRFFLIAAVMMTLVIFSGFSFQLAMGRSSFASPPLVHAHALVFMGWVVLFLLQNIFVATGRTALHRRLGWIGAGWIVAMVILGFLVTLRMVRGGTVPFFFQPVNFLIFDPVAVLTFAGLTIAAIINRRRTSWHRRLHYCAMSMLLGPAFGRLLPLPLLAPWAYEATFAALMLFPIAGVIADYRRSGSVHPAWRWGIGTMVASLLLTNAISYSPLGTAIYRMATAGSAGATIDPLAFPPPPPLAQLTGRPSK